MFYKIYIMKFEITLTASKILAFLLVIAGWCMGETAFMFAVPFASGLVLGKQYFDKTNK